MAIAYESAVTTIAAAAGASYAELQSNGTRRLKVREIGMFSQAATAASKTQLARPGNTPAGGAVTLGAPQDPADAAGTGGFTTTWSTAPTTPAAASVLRMFDFAAVIGSGLILTWPSDGEVVVAVSRANSLIVWNGSGSTGPLCDLYAVWSE